MGGGKKNSQALFSLKSSPTCSFSYLLVPLFIDLLFSMSLYIYLPLPSYLRIKPFTYLGPSAKAAVRTHLFSLLFEDCSKLCVELVEQSDTMQEIVELIEMTQTVLLNKANKNPESKIDGNYTPKWITPILLFIDLYEKVM